MRILPAGDSAWLIELPERIDPAINARAIRIARDVEAARLPVTDVVVGYRSVMVYVDPLAAGDDGGVDVARRLREFALARADGDTAPGPLVDVPVCYDGPFGPDLADVAAFGNCSVDEVIAMHLAREYRVFVVGFVPGFAYMASVDPRIAAPRRTSPRLKVPAGSVAVAAGQTGVYPAETPGGWSLIGRCPVKPYDADRAEPFLFHPGDRVRFSRISESAYHATTQWGDGVNSPDRGQTPAPERPGSDPGRSFTVLRAGMLSTVQDLGRTGYQGLGVPVSGPMDAYSHRLANAVLGNDPMAAALEITLLGPELLAEGEITCAMAGAESEVTVEGTPVPRDQPFAVPSGARLRFGGRGKGTRATLAVRGGFDLPPTLGSRATHLVSRMGPFGGRSLRAGDVLPVAAPHHAAAVNGSPIALPAGGATVRVLPAVHRERFTDDAWGVLMGTRYTVSPQSNRMGYRLDGPALAHVGAADILSEAMPLGAIQVPASGQPILLMAERQTTGGYATIANVITADLPIAGQLAPGDWIAFAPVTRAEAVAALRECEAALAGRRAWPAWQPT